MDFAYMAYALPRLLPGLWVTIEVSAISLALALVLGVFLGTLRSFTGWRNPLSWFTDAYVWLVRCTPIIVQIYAAYLLLPKAGIRLDVFWVGVVALTFNSVGYQAEIARAAIQSIGKGQSEGAAALGLTHWQSIRLVIVPQAIRRMIPALTNEMSHLIKASSVLSVITVLELHKVAENLQIQSFKFLELLALQALLYLPLILGLSRMAAWLDQAMMPGAGGRTGAAEEVR